MRTILLLLIGTMLSAQTCTTDQPDNADMTNKSEETMNSWKLVKMSGSMRNSETTGDDMAWQETIVLNDDNTFTKTRSEEDKDKTASGTYQYTDKSDGKYLELTYGSKNDLIANCTADLKEYLRVTEKNQLVGTWQACDGPGLYYQKTELR